jgi:hypothetical protein
MANLIRRPIPGKNWTAHELSAYNISIVQQDEQSFFGSPLPAFNGPLGFVQYENPVPGLDKPSLALIKRLKLAERIVKGETSAVDGFTAEILRALGFETGDALVCTRKSILLDICGRYDVETKADVCIVRVNIDDENILLVGQEDKSHIYRLDPEPPLVATMIAAFQENNRDTFYRWARSPILESQILSGITMKGVFPQFYKAKLTTDLDNCVQNGRYPAKETVIHRYTPQIQSGHKHAGMSLLDNRIHILRCYQAFKNVVFHKMLKCPFQFFFHN